jgi:L-2-hydroxyglutarate oxidase LhgO
MQFEITAVVVGAGVVGLACARRLALEGIDTLVIEAEGAIGQGISSRNSEVIHAGLYYATGSHKARLCVAGRHQLYAYCHERHVPHKRIGKWVVAVTESERAYLERIRTQAILNGVDDTYLIDGTEATRIEPEIRCEAALVSPSTGIVDSHALMQAFLGDLEAAGGLIAFNSRVQRICPQLDGLTLDVEGQETTQICARYVINAAGLEAPILASSLSPSGARLRRKFAKGSYFAYQGKVPFNRLVYPVPEPGGLGVHLTFDLAGQARFGPDVEWIHTPEYQVSEDKIPQFCHAIKKYWPDCESNRIVPAYAGIRPKVEIDGQLADDFLICDSHTHGINGLVDLCGIESPGLTASMALADEVVARLNLH